MSSHQDRARHINYLQFTLKGQRGSGERAVREIELDFKQHKNPEAIELLSELKRTQEAKSTLAQRELEIISSLSEVSKKITQATKETK